MKSANQYSFARVPSVEIPRSSFKRDRTYKTAFNSGYLIPFYNDEVYPGDTFNVKVQAFARLATPVLPFMDNVYLDFFFFFVPYRLLWSHWNNFLGEQDNPEDSTDYLTPILCTSYVNQGVLQKDRNVKSFDSGSLFDYLGFPIGHFGEHDAGETLEPLVDGIEVNAFLPRAYNKIWNDHFRDENLQDRVPELKDDGPDALVNYSLLRRGKRKDYFTSALPWPQKGPGAEINITARGYAPVFGDGNPLPLFNNVWEIGQAAHYGVLGTGGTDTLVMTSFGAYNPDVSEEITRFSQPSIQNRSPLGVATKDMLHDNPDSTFESSGLVSDLSNALFSPVSINDLRMAFQLQRLMEKNARGGTRLGEIILTHFGVVCPDFRLQRSEFLGGGEIPVQIHQVTQTSSSDGTTPQGNTAAFGLASGRVGFSKSFVEHGVVMGLVSARADLTYQQGLHRSWSRRSRYDYYWPSLAHLGEQAILNKEIFASGNLANDNKAFGYQERWAELRYGVSQVTGKLRSGVADSLDIWHLAQFFESVPTLNNTFVQDMPPIDRVVAVPSEPEFVFDSLIQCNCVRPLPLYSVPGLIDHF